jgi:hypothetical protein
MSVLLTIQPPIAEPGRIVASRRTLANPYVAPQMVNYSLRPAAAAKDIAVKLTLLVVALGGILIAAILLSVRVWFGMDAQMTGHGWFAMGLGVVLSIIVGAGLMALVFFSSRRGYDDEDREP